MASAAQNQRGIAFMLAAMTVFVCNDALMKVARQVYPAGQAVALRAAFAIFAALLLVLLFGDGGRLRSAVRPIVLLRGALDAAVALCFVWALGLMPIANATAITLASPIIMVAIAAATGIEQVGWRRALAVGVGFLGVLLILRPSAAGLEAAALVVVLSAVLASVRDLMTRRIGPDVPASVVSLTATMLTGLVALGLGATEEWTHAWRAETAYVALAALLVAIGTMFLVTAFRVADVGVVAGYRYAVVVFSLVIGYAVWGDIPDALAFCGIGLIVAAGVYTMHRQRVRPDSRLRIPTGPPA